MIRLSGIMGIPLLKKSRFTGSDGPLRYVFERQGGEEGDRLAVSCWFGELCSDATPQEDKTVRLFPFTGEGLEEAQNWLNGRLSQGGSGDDRERNLKDVD